MLMLIEPCACLDEGLSLASCCAVVAMVTGAGVVEKLAAKGISNSAVNLWRPLRVHRRECARVSVVRKRVCERVSARAPACVPVRIPLCTNTLESKRE